MSIHHGFLKPGIAGASPVKLAVVGLGKIQTSPDGINWTARVAPSLTMQYKSVCYSPSLGLFVACGNSNSVGAGNSFATSPDGITWTARTGPQAADWSGVAWSATNGVFVAVCNDSAAKTFAAASSTDGITWTGRTGLTGTWNSICWFEALGFFIAVSDGGSNKIMTSPTGTTWTTRTEPAVESWVAVAAAPVASLAVAHSSTGSGIAMSSAGTTWTQRTARKITTRAVCYFPPFSAFLAIGDTFASPSTHYDQRGDTTWSDGTLTTNSSWSGICYSPSLVLGVACSGGAANRIATTPDGVTWTIQTDAVNGTWMAACASS